MVPFCAMATPSMFNVFETVFQQGLVRPGDALFDLEVHPRKFLKRYAVACDEIIGQPSGTYQAYFYTSGGGDALRPGRYLRTKNMHKSDAYRFCLLNPPLGKPNNSYQVVTVHYVGMVPATAATTFGGIAWKPLPPTANIMVTVQLSGCTFLWRTQNGVLECAHLQPTGGLTGPTLQNQLQGNGADVYGRNDYGEGRVVTIVGVRRGAGWKIYAQKFRVLTAEILSVHRIHPA
jgi:hypothetical protein